MRVSPDARDRLLPALVGLESVYRRRAGEDVSLADYEPVMSELSALAPSDRAELVDWIERSSRKDASSVPAQIGRYPIVAELGEGGQARTYRAVHPGLQTTVVVKLAHRRAGPSTRDRIANEGRLLAAMPPHPHLVKVYDVDPHAGRVFLVLEDVSGPTLEEYVKGRGPEVGWSVQTVAALAGAVHVAHEQGIIHQDLNPRNVLIDGASRPRVIDFGMAWSRPWWVEPTDPASIGGAPRYLAPEQASRQSDRSGRTTDGFGLGGILDFLLTGSPFYPGDHLATVLQQARGARIARSLLDRTEIPPRLRSICLKALATEPRDRYATAADFAQALEQYLAPPRWRYPAVLG